jgi:hypothetical protein
MFERRACVHEANTHKRILQGAPMLCPLWVKRTCALQPAKLLRATSGHPRRCEGRVANLFPGGVRNAVIQK